MQKIKITFTNGKTEVWEDISNFEITYEKNGNISTIEFQLANINVGTGYPTWSVPAVSHLVFSMQHILYYEIIAVKQGETK